MLRRAWALAAVAAFLVATASAVRPDPSWYQKKKTWQDTMMASREAKARADAKGVEETVEPAAPKAAGGVQLGTWYQLGPFVPKQGRGFAQEFGPEQGVDVSKQCGGQTWVKKEYVDGNIYDLGMPDNSAVYLTRTLKSDAARTITGYFGSDDGLVVWLNGERLINNDVPRGPAPDQDTAKLALRAGDNQLLIKIYNISGGSGYYFSTVPSTNPGVVRTNDPQQPLWDLVARDFGQNGGAKEMQWEREDGIWTADWKPGDYQELARRYASAVRGWQSDRARKLALGVKDAAGLAEVRKLYAEGRQEDDAVSQAAGFPFEALRLAVADLTASYGDKYPKGKEYLAKLKSLEKQILADDADKRAAAVKELQALRTEALLANPLLAFDKLLLVKRDPKKLGLPQNWQGNSTIGPFGYDNEIDTLSIHTGEMKTLFRPEKTGFVGDLELHFNADRFLFSMPGTQGRFQVFEMKTDGTGLRQVTPGDQPDVDNYAGTYLPDGRIIFCSTACYLGVPCVGGSDFVGSLYLLNEKDKSIRQLTFDQDHSWCPHVLNNGQVIYTRWEYSDTPHYFSRLLFSMNPDGTSQFEYYGSDSYWPNSMFYARPVPGEPTMVSAIVSGHHGVPRMGELILFDPAKGRQEGDGVVQRIPGRGKKVEPIIADQLVDGVSPKFLHPFPLSKKYLLVSAQPTGKPWGIYLVDVFDNMICLAETPGYALLEPVPIQKRETPPVIPDRAKPGMKTATVYLQDVYRGPGLKGVPRGTVKALRVFANHYGYRGMGGHINIGIDGPWDVKRILGTVPVNPDGSAMFTVPANLPIGVEPLDADGKALQVMRSWYTAMPGEVASCIGCHEPQNASPIPRHSIAALKPPTPIEPWYGPARGFNFEHEVQAPVLQKYCVSCHNGQPRPDGKAIPDFRGRADADGYGSGFTPAYQALQRYVRRPGNESDYHVQIAAEWDPNTSELIQMLKKGHHGVKLSREAWDRLYTWIDLNVPCNGRWQENNGNAMRQNERMMELAKLYGGSDINHEQYPNLPPVDTTPVAPAPDAPTVVQAVDCPKWPFSAAEAKQRQDAVGPTRRTLDLGDGVKMELVRIPAGEFVMGSATGANDERPLSRVRIDKPFWMGTMEVTNAQYARFDPSHDNGVISMHNKDHNTRGYPINDPKEPVVRISWREAMRFCEWLSLQTGQRVTLPTEAQWEYACRAGTDTPFFFGDLDTDFAPFANMGDRSLQQLAVQGLPPRPVPNPNPMLDWVPKEMRFDDKALLPTPPGSYQANPWGLFDMHGNVAEWTRSTYRPYPYRSDDGRDNASPDGEKVVRGGSWFDRPYRCTSSYRLSYPSWQGVYNVGFRIIIEDGPKAPQTARK